MKFSLTAASLLAAGAAATPTLAPAKRATGVTPITIKGNAFFQGDKRFYIRGVDYQPGGASDPKDPIADTAGCKRDIEKFKELGLNTIRVYTIDNSLKHDECMQALADAGIYVALDVNSRYYSLNRKDQKAIQKSYNKVYLQSVFATIDIFAKYDNTLLFFSANEVLDAPDTSACAPYVKAVNRDMKSYINARKYRNIPVGYSAADVTANRLEMAQYMNCGPDAARADFYAFNDYSWCDPDEYSTTDWAQKVKNFTDYGKPLFLSEYGCNRNKRQFKQVAALYSDKMWSVYSGGLVYEYTQEEADYGLVDIKGNSVETRPDYAALKSAFDKTPIPTSDGNYKTDGKASACPKKSNLWEVDMKDDELPAMPDGIDEYFKNGAGKGPGLTGGSQDAGSTEQKLAPAASGAVTTGATASGSGSSGSDKSAAAGLQPPSFMTAPIITGAVVLFSALASANLL